MNAYEKAKTEEEIAVLEIEGRIVPTRFDDCFTHASIPQGVRRVRSWRTSDGKYSGTVTLEQVNVKGYTPWTAVLEMTSHSRRMHCIAWVIYLIENGRGSIKPLETK